MGYGGKHTHGSKVRLYDGTRRGVACHPMPALVEALTLSSLVAGTLEYAILLRHREERRRDAAHAALASDLGREALLRMSLLDRGAPRRWSSFGSRYR